MTKYKKRNNSDNSWHLTSTAAANVVIPHRIDRISLKVLIQSAFVCQYMNMNFAIPLLYIAENVQKQWHAFMASVIRDLIHE